MNDVNINLVSEDVLQSREKERKTVKTKFVSFFVIAVSILALVVLVFFYFWFQSRLDRILEQKLFLESSIKSNQAVERVAVDLKKRSEVFGQLYDSRLSYSDIVSRLSNLLPQEILLESFSFKDTGVVLSGETTSYSSLAQFIKEGNNNVKEVREDFPFTSVVLKQASLDSQTGKISFTVDFNLNTDRGSNVVLKEPIL